jgi:hypothetical protein
MCAHFSPLLREVRIDSRFAGRVGRTLLSDAFGSYRSSALVEQRFSAALTISILCHSEPRRSIRDANAPAIRGICF